MNNTETPATYKIRSLNQAVAGKGNLFGLYETGKTRRIAEGTKTEMRALMVHLEARAR